MNSLRGYADAAWTRNMTMRKSTSGYVFQIETKYMTLSNTKQEAIWLQTLPNAMGFDQAKPTTLFEDKQGAIELAKNPSHHSETKHITLSSIMYVLLLLQRRLIYNTALHRKLLLIG